MSTSTKKVVRVVCLSSLAVLSLSAMTCLSQVPWANQHPLEGTWTLITSPTAGRDLGMGSFTISHTDTQDTGSLVIHNYSGTGTLFGRDFDVTARQEEKDAADEVIVAFMEVADDGNALSLHDATLDGDGELISGATYVGTNEYAADAGSFTAEKQ